MFLNKRFPMFFFLVGREEEKKQGGQGVIR